MGQLFVGLMAEGKTDHQFLRSIVEKTIINIAYDCKGQLDIQVFLIEYEKSGTFVDYVFNASKRAHSEIGALILVVHSDADSLSSENTYTNKMNPAKEYISSKEDNTLCKNIVELVPVYETESWMLADKEYFKKQIGTKKSDSELGIDGDPETFSRPKERIEEAIRIATSTLSSKLRKKIKINELYSIFGDALEISKLDRFSSYRDFAGNIRRELIYLNLLESKSN